MISMGRSIKIEGGRRGIGKEERGWCGASLIITIERVEGLRR